MAPGGCTGRACTPAQEVKKFLGGGSESKSVALHFLVCFIGEMERIGGNIWNAKGSTLWGCPLPERQLVLKPLAEGVQSCQYCELQMGHFCHRDSSGACLGSKISSLFEECTHKEPKMRREGKTGHIDLCPGQKNPLWRKQTVEALIYDNVKLFSRSRRAALLTVLLQRMRLG